MNQKTLISLLQKEARYEYIKTIGWVRESDVILLDELIASAVTKTARAVVEECLLEVKDLVLPENHEANGKAIYDWEGQDLFHLGQKSSIAAFRDNYKRFSEEGV